MLYTWKLGDKNLYYSCTGAYSEPHCWQKETTKWWNLGSTQLLLRGRTLPGHKATRLLQHQLKAWVAMGCGRAGLYHEGHRKHSPDNQDHQLRVSLGTPACNCKLVRTGPSMWHRKGEVGEGSSSILAAGPISALYCWLVFQWTFTSHL